MNSFFKKLIVTISACLISVLANFALTISMNFSYYSRNEVFANDITCAKLDEATGKFRMQLIAKNPRGSFFYYNYIATNTASGGEFNAYGYMKFGDLGSFVINDGSSTYENPVGLYGFTTQSPILEPLYLNVLYGEIADEGFCRDTGSNVAISKTLAQDIADLKGIEVSDVVGLTITPSIVDSPMLIAAVVENRFVGNNFAEDDPFIIGEFSWFSRRSDYEALNILASTDYYSNFSLIDHVYKYLSVVIEGGVHTMNTPNNEWIMEEIAKLEAKEMPNLSFVTYLYVFANLATGLCCLYFAKKWDLSRSKTRIAFVVLFFASLYSGYLFSNILNHMYIGGIHISSQLSLTTLIEVFGAALCSVPVLFHRKEEADCICHSKEIEI